MTIGIIVHTRRKQLGWSQVELSRKAGIAQSQVSRLESGSGGNITIGNLRGLARAFGCRVIDLLPEQDWQPLAGKREESQEETEPLSIEALAKRVSELEKRLEKNNNGGQEIEDVRP